MPKKIREEVFKRIIFAKKLYKDGELACNIGNDQMVFAKGLLLLHDATENALGAIKKTRGRFFVCQSPITVDKEYIYQDGVYTW